MFIRLITQQRNVTFDLLFAVHICTMKVHLQLYLILCSPSLYVTFYMKFMEGGGRYSLIGIENNFGLQSSGSNLLVGASIFDLSQTAHRSYSTNCSKGTVYFPTKNMPRRGGDHPLHLATKLKKNNRSWSVPA